MKDKLSRREFLMESVVALGLLVQAGCNPVGTATRVLESATPPSVSTSPGSTEQQGPTVLPSEVPILNVKAEGGGYSAEQLKQIQENEVLRKKVRVVTEDWIRWGATADSPAVSVDALNTGRVNVAVKFDVREPENGNKAIAVLESQDYPGQHIKQPWDFAKGDFMVSVPDFDAQGNAIDKSPGHANVTGMGLFLMSESGVELSDGRRVDWIWQNLGGRPARVDAKTGQLLERINAVGQWEKTESDIYRLQGSELSIYNSGTNSLEVARNDQGQPLEVTAVKEIEEGKLVVASRNQMLEWKEGQGLNKSETKGVWPKEIEIKMIEEAEQLDRNGKSVGKIYNGKDQLGRTMLVKPAGEENWLGGPLGSTLHNRKRGGGG